MNPKTRLMKNFIFYFFLCFVATVFAQKKNVSQSIISDDVSIKKYHNKSELNRMDKGELLILYIERIESLVKTLPYIAFTTKPGKTLSSFGIPNSKSNIKAMKEKEHATFDFIEITSGFQKKMLPYADKNNLISGILFYEETMRLLHEYNEIIE
jgi:hypothetical protein